MAISIIPPLKRLEQFLTEARNLPEQDDSQASSSIIRRIRTFIEYEYSEKGREDKLFELGQIDINGNWSLGKSKLTTFVEALLDEWAQYGSTKEVPSFVPGKMRRVIRVFIGSPGDLLKERVQFRKGINYINETIGKHIGVHIESVGWEDTLTGRGRAQDLINKDLLSCELAVLLLGEKWGSNTNRYTSGFEEEYHVAIESDIQIWMFFRDISKESKENPDTQLSKVLEFRRLMESEKRVYYKTFTDEYDWAELFKKQLSEWILTNHIEPISVQSNRRNSAVVDGIALGGIQESKRTDEHVVTAIDTTMKQEQSTAQQIDILDESRINEIVELTQFSKCTDMLFQRQAEGRRILRLTITPTILSKDMVDITDSSIHRLLEDPPHQRYGGWNVQAVRPIKADVIGLYLSEFSQRHVRLFKNGHLEFNTEIDDGFCWRQSDEEFKKAPRLYPYSVIEYPYSFLLLSKELYKNIGITCGFIWRMIYWNLKGCTMLPGHPDSFFFRSQHTNTIYPYSHYTSKLNLDNDFEPNEATYKMVKEFYMAFGYMEDRMIPLFDENHNVIL